MKIKNKFVWWVAAAILSVSMLNACGDSSYDKRLRCDEIALLKIDNVTILSATDVDGSGDPLGYCQVLGVIGTDIKFEVKLPPSWNGKFYMGGGGGMVGGIQCQGWEDALARGYATAGTDTGHQSNGNLSAAWALDNDEAYINFGHRGVHLTAATAKIIIRAYYDSDIRYSYFSGCSTGGRMAMMESQRYPMDFDGIIVGSPCNDYRPDNLIWIQQGLFPDIVTDINNPSAWVSILPLDKLALVEATVIAACDSADGVVDGIVGDPSTCLFNPATDFPMCPGDVDPGDNSCLTTTELAALLRIYDGPIDQTESEELGYAYCGCENHPDWKSWMVYDSFWPEYIGVPNLGYSFAQEELRYFVYDDPTYDLHDFDLTNPDNMEDLEAMTDPASAIDTNLSEFRDRGGKMIMYHGWCDPILSPYMTIRYYEGVEANSANTNGTTENVRDFIRLFLAPGMLHCSGGPGPSSVDYLTALENWVENGNAPDSLLASGGEEPDRTRILCPYPKVAVWNGTGDSDKAANFTCQAP